MPAYRTTVASLSAVVVASSVLGVVDSRGPLHSFQSSWGPRPTPTRGHGTPHSRVPWAAGAAYNLATLAGQTQTQLPLEPVRASGQGVTGAFEGWYQNPDGSFSLLVGYFSRNEKATLDIPVGPNNRIEPGGPDQGQPTHFLPRRQWGVFTVTVPKDFGDKKLTWTLVAHGETTSIPLSLNPLWAVQPFKDPAVGNTPPVVRLESGGAALQGPPRGIAASFTTTVPDPVTLTVWVTDDLRQDPVERPRPEQLPITVSWSKARGPGSVTFSHPKPEVDKADGKATTTATFATPGEYLVRGQVNDLSGEGGGGNQCCWTNVLVKVTVSPSPLARIIHEGRIIRPSGFDFGRRRAFAQG